MVTVMVMVMVLVMQVKNTVAGSDGRGKGDVVER